MDDFFSAKKAGMAIDLEEVVDATFAEQTRALVAAGALVSVGTTRDGGALSLTVTWDGQWRREYLTSADECREYLDAAIKTIMALGGRPPAPTVEGRRNRGRRGT